MLLQQDRHRGAGQIEPNRVGLGRDGGVDGQARDEAAFAEILARLETHDFNRHFVDTGRRRENSVSDGGDRFGDFPLFEDDVPGDSSRRTNASASWPQQQTEDVEAFDEPLLHVRLSRAGALLGRRDQRVERFEVPVSGVIKAIQRFVRPPSVRSEENDLVVRGRHPMLLVEIVGAGCSAMPTQVSTPKRKARITSEGRNSEGA